MNLDISFIFGLLSSVAALASLQLKSIRLILLCQFICNGTGALSYVLSGGFSGSGIYMVAILQSLMFFILRAKDKETPSFMAPVFALCYLVCSAFTYKSTLDIIPALAALTCAFGLSQKIPSRYRLLILANGILWLIYDLILPASATMALSHVITIISAVVGIIRLDVLDKKDKTLTEKKS